MSRSLSIFIVLSLAPLTSPTHLDAQSHGEDAERLVAAMLGDTPLFDDLATLTDEIGGRATGTRANLRAVDWALDRFRDAGVRARKEAFTMPTLWLERSARATVSGDGVRFTPRVAAMPYSAPAAGLTRPLLDAGHGSESDFERLGERARDAFLLVETPLLRDIAGLFAEYTDAAAIEGRAFAAGAAGVVYMGARSKNALYRHNVSVRDRNTRPMLIMERVAAERALRLLRRGEGLELTVTLDLRTGPAYESYNVIGEIPGSAKAEEVVVMGAHLDSWDLGTGALDNGANVAMMIDIARQMRRLGIRPARTIRFALWNGEEQGLFGSFGYVQSHAAELDRHVMAGSVDIGCGRITGFFTNGRAELLPVLDRALAPVKGLGPFRHINAPVVGTDNYDFMMEGVANLVANHEPATYGPNYHAATDQFDECDLESLRLNAAIVAAVVYEFAQGQVDWSRQTAAQVEELVNTTSLGQQMRTFGMWEAWVDGRRGRRP